MLKKFISHIDILYLLVILLLVLLSVIVLHSIAPQLFPQYYFYIVLALASFLIFSSIDFDIVSLFAKHFYILGLIFLLLPLLIGQVTRGAVRWINIGALGIQPAEIVRPFLLLFFANYISSKELNAKNISILLVLLVVPVLLILVQPSLGVAFLTMLGFLGVVLASRINKKTILFTILFFIMLIPIGYFLLAPYQKARIVGFLNPGEDPYGSGYNSIQSMIAVGSGRFFGRGLGKGVQTQLSFLPERQTDFIFASIAEELGLIGAGIVLFLQLLLFNKIISFIDNSISPAARAFISGVFLTMFAQIFINVGMNMGLLPITGIPFPLVSAGGSSLLATMISLGMVIAARKHQAT